MAVNYYVFPQKEYKTVLDGLVILIRQKNFIFNHAIKETVVERLSTIQHFLHCPSSYLLCLMLANINHIIPRAFFLSFQLVLWWWKATRHSLHSCPFGNLVFYSHCFVLLVICLTANFVQTNQVMLQGHQECSRKQHLGVLCAVLWRNETIWLTG